MIDAAAVGARTLATLDKLGSVKTITSGNPTPGGEAAAENAIEIARYTNGNFGWGVKEPGHGLVFANASRPLDGPGSGAALLDRRLRAAAAAAKRDAGSAEARRLPVRHPARVRLTAVPAGRAASTITAG